jgi:hypothetical protein
MRFPRIGFSAVCVLAGLGSPSKDAAEHQAAATNGSKSTSISAAASPRTRDDLDWLIGRWKCVGREYLTKPQQMLAPDAEDSLEYLNVYCPYANDHLTLDLTDAPDERPIAAEFLVRFVDETSATFTERLEPMSPWGSVRIGRRTIRYGAPPAEDIEFHYRLEKRGTRLWLTLESKVMRLELVKLALPLGDVRESHVQAPIRSYTPAQIADLKERYERMKHSSHQGP